MSDNIKVINNQAFYGCVGLQEISLSNRLSEIGTEAFAGCTALEEISIPKSVAKIAGFAFYNSALEKVTFPYAKAWTVTFDATYSVSNTFSVIGENSGTSTMTMTGPEYVSVMGPYSKVPYVDIDLSNEEVVARCLRDVYVNGIRHNMYAADWTSPVYEEPEATEGLEYYLLDDGTYGVMAGTTYYLSEITVPAIYNGKAVTKILPNAFKDAINLKTINLPNTLTEIGEYAFYGCMNLESYIAIPEGQTEVPTYCFYKCKNIENINIPSTVIKINKYALYNVPSITVEGTNKWNVSDCKMGETSTFSNRTLTAENYKDYTSYDSDYWVTYYYYPSSGVWKR